MLCLSGKRRLQRLRINYLSSAGRTGKRSLGDAGFAPRFHVLIPVAARAWVCSILFELLGQFCDNA